MGGGGVGRALLQMGTAGAWTPSSGQIKVDKQKFQASTKEEQKAQELANQSEAASAAADRRRRLAASRGRQNLRHDLAYPQDGVGLSIRGRQRAAANS